MTIRWIAFEKWTDLPRSQLLRRLHRLTVELFDSVTLVNVFISIAIGPASLSLVRSGPPPIFEDEILRLINGTQFWLLGLYCLIGFCLAPFRSRSRLRCCVLAVCGGFTCYMMYLDYFLSHRVNSCCQRDGWLGWFGMTREYHRYQGAQPPKSSWHPTDIPGQVTAIWTAHKWPRRRYIAY